MLLGIWGVFRDVRALRETALDKEISTIRSHAIRTVSRIERSFEQEGNTLDLTSIRGDAWIRRFWEHVVPREDRRSYAAIVARDGTVVMHSDRRIEAAALSGDGLTSTQQPNDAMLAVVNNPLANGHSAYDVRLPIEIGSILLGHYHAGIDMDWFEQQSRHRRSQIIRRWSIVIAGITLVVLMAAASLYYLTSRAAGLQSAADMIQMQRVTELGQMAVGLAHEIRNPLHALRLNLHALRRLQRSDVDALNSTEMEKIVDESNSEIARLDRLVSELLGFAKPEEAHDEVVDIVSELRTLLSFLTQEMQANNIELNLASQLDSALIRMDSARFRQVGLNLLSNAKEAIDEEGHINVQVVRHEDRVVVEVRDDGHGIEAEDSSQIFDPFFTTKEDGSGLGLSLVKRFVEEADGHVTCERLRRGTAFRLTFPAAAN